VTLSDGLELRGVVQHADAMADIAIVRVNSSKPLPTVRLGTSGSLRPGEFVIALGAPANLSNSVSMGIVSAVARARREIVGRPGGGGANARANAMEYIQTDAAINTGNSGGPLLNLDGEVIGVNTMKVANADGIAFALPIDDVKRVVNDLQRHGRVLRPYLGLKFVELDLNTAAELRKRAADGTGGVWGRSRGSGPPDAGLYVIHVTPGSPAQRAGVRVGDTLIGLDGTTLKTTKGLLDGLQDHVGKAVTLEVMRSDQCMGVRCDVEAMQD